MASVVEFVRELVTLGSEVGAIKDRIQRLADAVDNHAERIVKLESREEALKHEMANAALEAVSRMHMRVLDRIVQLESRAGLPPPDSR